MANQTPTIRKHYPGCFRVSLPTGDFGQIKRHGHLWHAEIRSGDGTLKRYAGIWNTRRQAIEEVVSIYDWIK